MVKAVYQHFWIDYANSYKFDTNTLIDISYQYKTNVTKAVKPQVGEVWKEEEAASKIPNPDYLNMKDIYHLFYPQSKKSDGFLSTCWEKCGPCNTQSYPSPE